MTNKGQILRSASVITLVTLISRICGYLRDQRVALLLGTSPAADSFILAFRIPSMIRRMTAEGSLGASFIPLFTGYLHNRTREDAWVFAQRVFWVLAIVLAIVSLSAAIFSRQVVFVWTILGARHAHWELAVFLNRIIFPAVFFIGLAAVAAAILNSFQVFGLPASTPIFFNLIFIAFSFGFLYRPILRWAPAEFRTPAVALAVAVLVGSAAQLFIQVPALARRGMSFVPQVSFSDPGVRKFARLMGPAFFGTGVYQVNLVVDTIFATSPRMPTGSITSLYIADRLMQLVLGSYAIAMSTAILPAMSHQIAAGKWDEMKHTFGFSLRIVSFITIPAAVGLILLRRPIVQILFQHGQFVAESTSLTAHALLFYSLGLPAYAAIKLITPMYYSTQDTWSPARIGAWALAANVLLNVIFLLFFYRSLSNGGPALASSLTAYFNFAALFLLFRKRYGPLGASGVVASLIKIAMCAVVMAAISYFGLRIAGVSSAGHWLTQAALLMAVILASTLAYFGLAWLLRCEELREFWQLLRRTEAGTAPLAAGEV
ncbi:MAG TPA: murein biosynthesis integral membrane protein MurJ [Candidatus Baltobacteraceae bacterium]|nr:murein biosynthesis integral membrane protein MurJ [Candidatus Baltobacteraceae bacterium]